jgi:hypothetical protein
MAGSTQIAASKETFHLSEGTMRVRVDPRATPVGQPELVAHALADDLLFLIPRMRLDLADLLGIPTDAFLSQGEDLIEELCDDVERMLRLGLLAAVHLLLCEPTPDPTTGSSIVRYACEYTVLPPRPGSAESRPDALRAALAPEQRPLDELRLALVVQWDPKADWRERAQLRRPQFNFDWSSPLDPFYPASVVRFSQEGAGASASLLQNG